jgi:Leucine-rich repeat (LRR) protein
VTALERWRSLSLYNTSVTDEGIRTLSQASGLEEIHVVSDLLTDDCMPAVCSLPRLRSLLFDGVPGVTDRGIAALTNVRDLRELYLNGTQLTDRGLRHVAHLKDLWNLCLNDTRVSDEGVRLFGSLQSLNLLSLERTKVTGRTFASVVNNDCFSLYLGGAEVDDDGVRVITERLTNLMRLDLSGTRITDRSVPYLARLPKLNDVRLRHTDISDEGLQVLFNHPSLEAIYLQGTKVSDFGIGKLMRTLPKLTVYRDED